MPLLNFFRRKGLSIVIWALKQHKADQEELLRTCLSAEESGSLMKRREGTKRQIEKAQNAYSALLPVGVCRIWEAA